MLSSRVPELSALQMLRTVQELGSFSAAGKALGLSQQAVSSRMRALEGLIGVVLIARSPRGSTLTAAGALVAGWAREVLGAAEQLDAGIASIRHEGAARMHVVASQTIAEHLLPGWLVTLRRHQETAGQVPTVIDLSVTNSRMAAALVRAGDVAVGFIESTLLPSDLGSTMLRRDEMVVVVRPGHRWTRRRTPLGAEELARTPLVTREVGSGTRDALESILAQQAPEFAMADSALELSTSAAVRSAIIAGTAPGVLSRLAVRDDLTLGRLAEVATGEPLLRPLTAIWQNHGAPPSGPAGDLIAIAAQDPAARADRD